MALWWNKEEVRTFYQIEHNKVMGLLIETYFNSKNSNPKFLKKTNINEINNTSSKTHNYCKSDIRDKIIDLKSKYSYLKRNN